jgi:cellulose 1,4-beta-cellobiosidase
MRLGSVTHAFNMEQRLIGLCGVTSPCSALSNTLNLTTPPSGNVAPPGYYMLFLIDSAGVPSVATFIQLSPFVSAPPQGTITTPAGNVTINAGQAVNFSTTSSAAAYSWVFPGGTPATSVSPSQSVTFANAGTYAVSLTVIDSSGHSDPNPPTRTITVLPATADFSISVVQAAQEVVPGGSATYSVSVTGLSGFSAPVSLSVGSESGFQTGITSGGFNPASISGAGTSTLTMNTTTSTVPWALSLTITGTSGTLSHTASSTLLVNLAPPGSPATIAGDKQVSLSWSPSVEATTYHVKRATTAGGPYETVACVAATTTNYTDPGLVDGTTYYYVVSAAYAGNPNSGGESANSSEVSATPQATQTPPLAPTALTAKATKPKAIDLQWVQSVTSGIANNHIYRRLMNGGAYPSSPITINPTTSYRDSNLVSRTGYCYVVTASNASGESARSNEACASPK